MPIKPRIPPTSVTQYSPSLSIHSTEKDARYFRIFGEQSAFELSGFFDTDFWARVVLQESHQNTAIRHAVMALGALHKSLEAAPGPHLKVNVLQTLDRKHYEPAILHHIKSIQALNHYISSSNPPQLRVVLINCLLYICFETFLGNLASSIQQTYGGLKILKDYYVGKPGSKPWIPSKPSTNAIRNRRTDISKALQIRPGCDSVSKDVTMTKHMEEYLEMESDTDNKVHTREQDPVTAPGSYAFDPHAVQVGLSSTKKTETKFDIDKQQTMMSIASEKSLLYSSDSRQIPHESSSSSSSQASSQDIHEQIGFQSQNMSTGRTPHTTSFAKSIPATYDTPSTSGNTSPGHAPISQSESASLNSSLNFNSGGESPTSPPILLNDNPLEDSLIQTFVRLDGHGMFFGMVPGIPPLIWDIHQQHHLPIPPTFTNFPTAHRCWDFLMDRCLQFYRRTLFNRAFAPNSNPPEFEIKRKYAYYIRQLSSFASAYKPLLDRAISPAGEILHPSALILSLHHKATIITLAAVTSDSEIVYDAFLPDFQYITHTCALLIASQSVKGPRNPRFSLDVGIVPPLHITATKCRNPVVRREAVNLLFASPRQEGIWDGVLTARIGKWITSCEEEGLSLNLGESGISQIQSPQEVGGHESYPSPASVNGESDRENGGRMSNGATGDHDEHESVKVGREGDIRTGLWSPDRVSISNQKGGPKHDERKSDTRHGMVPEENRVQLTVVDFHIPDRYIKVKCQKALVGENGLREQRETVIAW